MLIFDVGLVTENFLEKNGGRDILKSLFYWIHIKFNLQIYLEWTQSTLYIYISIAQPFPSRSLLSPLGLPIFGLNLQEKNVQFCT
jgi:hypothetical protein